MAKTATAWFKIPCSLIVTRRGVPRHADSKTTEARGVEAHVSV